MPSVRTLGLLLILKYSIWRELKRDRTMEDDKSLNPDNIFCQAQVDVQKMIDQLEEQVESDQEEE